MAPALVVTGVYLGACVCRAWGKVKDVTSLIASSKSRPRVGKAISIPIELPEDVLREWFLIH